MEIKTIEEFNGVLRSCKTSDEMLEAHRNFAKNYHGYITINNAIFNMDLIKIHEIWGKRLFVGLPLDYEKNGVAQYSVYSFEEMESFFLGEKALKQNKRICYRVADITRKKINVFTKDDLLEELKRIKDIVHGDVAIQMDRVDMDFINKAHDIIGNKLKIIPEEGQEKKKYVDFGHFPVYTYEEIRDSEEKINLLVKSAFDYYDKNGELKSLSPLEKVVAAWILTTKFAIPKNEDDHNLTNENYHISRSVYELVKQNEDCRIVCLGYARIFREFLYRLGIEDTATIIFSFNYDEDNEYGTKDGHARTLLHLVDPKYRIEGVYMSDPTDDAGRIDHLSITHMLMSRDDISKLKWSKREEEGYYDVDLSLGISGMNEKCDWELTNKLNVDNPEALFHNSIPQDTLVRAFLAVDHFLDKNLKMVNNDEYSSFELYNMAIKLGFHDLAKEYSKKIYSEGKDWPLSEVLSHVNLGNIYCGADELFLNIVSDKITVERYKNYLYSFSIRKNSIKKEGNKAFLEAIVFPDSVGEDVIDKLSNNWKILERDDTSPVIFKLHVLDNRPFVEQFDELNKICESFNREIIGLLQEKNETEKK